MLAETLADERPDRDHLAQLADDPETLDQLLDDERLFERLVEASPLLAVSRWLFWYVVVRRTLLDHGITDRDVADYVGALLADRVEPRSSGCDSAFLVDHFHATTEARSEDDRFARHARLGNTALFLSGMFPDRIYHRHTYGRRPVSLRYYEDMGRLGYDAAARSRAAESYQLAEVLAFMADTFSSLRQALNDLVDNHLHLAPRPETIDRLCRQAQYRTSGG